ncbi:hypothetical protein [Pseudonocardia acidicola]|uniref:Uncharacterized protein n=1 Tax=Pseudonocardia acidicola TaxID=2724939 RepID=A0ABX1SIT6_9PSEU|nr:hypothetical protein [Pseudonocardia acidicola]NMI00160.1 hypothetical protein [Pseudonocardia acidicola]
MISFPAPALCQGADEDLLIEIGGVVFPGCIKRSQGENGLRLWVEGGPTDPAVRIDALAKFQTVLGVLRAWRSGAGERRDEMRAGLGDGPVRDEDGNQWILAGSTISYGIMGGEIEKLAAGARLGLDASQNLRNALWLNGRLDQTAADFYMIHEYAEEEFGGTRGITDVLGLSGKSQSSLTKSANSLSPLAGGRHAKADAVAAMTLDEQCEYVAELLRLWIAQYE